MLKPIIVGIDPGTTTAVAILDLSGSLIAVKSKKEFSKADVVDFITQYGKPVLISTDKSKTPFLVEKISALFGCELFKPEQDISVKEKNGLAKDIEVSNRHEKDALAAAKAAYKSKATQFSKINANVSVSQDAVKQMILEKRAKNIKEALEKLNLSL